MNRATDELEDWLASAVVDSPSGIAAAATNDAIGAVSADAAAAIVDALNGNGYQVSRSDHVLCDFLASIACAMERFQQEVKHSVEYIVSAILRSRKKAKRSAIPRPAVSVAAKATAVPRSFGGWNQGS